MHHDYRKMKDICERIASTGDLEATASGTEVNSAEKTEGDNGAKVAGVVIGRAKVANANEELMSYYSLVEELEDLCQWTDADGKKDRKDFFVYFQDAIISAYYRYVATKAKAWSKVRNILLWIGTIVVPILSTFAIGFLTEGGESAKEATGIIVGSAATVLWLLVSIYLESSKKRAYDETWVRHSACYNRLHLNLNAFLTSDRSDEKYTEFVTNTFAVLDQNLDQFVQNLSSHGMASRLKTAVKKG